MRGTTKNILILAACAAMVPVSVQAAPFVTTTTTKQSSAFTVSATDLLNGLAPASGSVLGNRSGSESTNTDPAVLTNGDFGALPTSGSGNADAFGVTTGKSTDTATVLYYNLDLNASPGGYAITEINTYTGRGGGGGRTQQEYTLSYAAVDSPTSFFPLVSIAATPWANDLAVRVAHTITDLEGVAALKFEFTDGVANDWIAYREIDVIGAPVPEPASLGVLAIGAMGLLVRRWRMA